MPPRSARPLLAAVLAGAALLASACGGNDVTEKKVVTRAQYVAQVDALCRKVKRESASRDRRLQALVDGSGSFAGRLRKGAPLLREFHEVQTAKLDRLERIEAPAADRAKIGQMTAAADSALKDLGESLPAADRGDLPAFIDLVFDASGARTRAEQLGEDLGLRADCFGLPVKIG